MGDCNLGKGKIPYEISGSEVMSHYTPKVAKKNLAFAPEFAILRAQNLDNLDFWADNVAVGTAVLKGKDKSGKNVYVVVNDFSFNPILQDAENVANCFKDGRMVAQAYKLCRNIVSDLSSLNLEELRNYSAVKILPAKQVLAAGQGRMSREKLNNHPLLQAIFGRRDILEAYNAKDPQCSTGQNYFWFDDRDNFSTPTARYFVFGNTDFSLNAIRDINSKAKFVTLPQGSRESIQKYLAN